MTIIVLDTETTGLPKNYKAPVTDSENWPRLVQIAWEVYENDGTQVDQAEYIITPNGFDIPDEVANIHGITTQRAFDEGISLDTVLVLLANDLERADLVVSHNIAYDEKILGAEFWREWKKNPLEQNKTACTMVASVDYCAIPGPYGNKWPKLAELYRVLFAEVLEGEHNAVVDCAAAARCFWELVRLGVMEVPAAPQNTDPEFQPVAQVESAPTWQAEPLHMTDEEVVEFLEELDDEEELLTPIQLQKMIIREYDELDQCRMTQHHTTRTLLEAQRELDGKNWALRQTDEYKACKNDTARADYLYGQADSTAQAVDVAQCDADGAKLDFERAHDRVERTRALLRIAELAAGIERAK